MFHREELHHSVAILAQACAVVPRISYHPAMASSPQNSDRMSDFKRKFSLMSASAASTFSGDASSVSSSDECFIEKNFTTPDDASTLSCETDAPKELKRTFAGADDSPFPVTYFDRKDMPFSREMYAESLWGNANGEGHVAEQIQAHGCYFPTEPYVEPFQNCAAPPNRAVLDATPPILVPDQSVMLPLSRFNGMPVQMVLMPIQSAVHKPPGMLTQAKKTSQPQPDPLPFSSVAPDSPAPAQKEQHAPKAASKQNVNVKTNVPAKNQSTIDSMPADKKEALCKYIYDSMLQKGLTSPEGYLLVDVFDDVWKEMSDGHGSRAAQQRFSELLRSAPQYFKLFRKSIQVANHCGWFARKGERMVMLVSEEEQ
jgi:hypothetical protein